MKVCVKGSLYCNFAFSLPDVTIVRKIAFWSVQTPCECAHALAFLQVSFAAVALALLSSVILAPSAEAATNYTDADILQFALNLEVQGFCTALASKSC